jgi:nitrogen fixation NifU-like protein
MEHFSEPRNFGRMEGADFVGVAGLPGQGRYLVIYMKLESRRIAEATFHCHGCGATIACGSMLTEMITGKVVDECRELTAGNLIAALGGLPPDKKHCAGFAVQALKNALAMEEEDLATEGTEATEKGK